MVNKSKPTPFQGKYGNGKRLGTLADSFVSAGTLPSTMNPELPSVSQASPKNKSVGYYWVDTPYQEKVPGWNFPEEPAGSEPRVMSEPPVPSRAQASVEPRAASAEPRTSPEVHAPVKSSATLGPSASGEVRASPELGASSDSSDTPERSTFLNSGASPELHGPFSSSVSPGPSASSGSRMTTKTKSSRPAAPPVKTTKSGRTQWARPNRDTPSKPIVYHEPQKQEGYIPWQAEETESPEQFKPNMGPWGMVYPTKPWVDPTPPKTEEQLVQERVQKNLLGWPWTGVPDKLITLAPYHINEHPLQSVLALPRVQQTSPFFTKILNHNDIGFELLKVLFKSHSCSWKLAATCQEAFALLSNQVDIWDMTSGWFNNCEKDFKQAEEKHSIALQASTSAHLIVTPFRRPEGPATFVEQVKNIKLLAMSVRNFGHCLRNVHFHRVPFLSIRWLHVLIPHMTNLEVLGIYNCQMIHIGVGLKLLAILKEDRLKGKENSVALDFYPNWHEGPEDRQHYVGTYGVSWDNLNMDTTIGIWSIALRMMERARAQGIDLESKHTMFRQWLEKSPCWRVEETIKAYFSSDFDPLLLASKVMFRYCYNRPQRLQQMLRYRDVPKWWTSIIQCGRCGDKQQGVFFWRDHARWNEIEGVPQHPPCYGCILLRHLAQETDHYKNKKHQVTKRWLQIEEEVEPVEELGAAQAPQLQFVNVVQPNGQPGVQLVLAPTIQTASGPAPKEAKLGWNTNDITRAIDDYDENGIEQIAEALDELHEWDMTQDDEDCYDRLTQERQRELSFDEMKGRRGHFLRSPDAHEENNLEAAYDDRTPGIWREVRDLTRYDMHPLHY